MIAFIDEMKDRLGVELVCRTMRSAEVGFVSSRGYLTAKGRPASARALSDQMIGGEIARLHAENYGVYGVRKMHRLLHGQAGVVSLQALFHCARSESGGRIAEKKIVWGMEPDFESLTLSAGFWG